MRIVHIAPTAPYNEGWGYQENLLPKYQKKLGHEVTLIVTNTMHRDGRIVPTDCTDKVLEDGVRLIRRPIAQKCHRLLTGMMAHLPAADLLEELAPDLIFFHGLISVTILEAAAYKKKHPSCVIVQDNHMDYYNMPAGRSPLRSRVIRSWYRLLNRRSIPYVDRVYGVTPWRSQFAQEYFGIPKEKTGLLVMGADDEKVHFDRMPGLRTELRRELGFAEGDFVVVTGGKIDRNKNIHLLMQAVAELDRPGLKLLVFGSPDEEMAPEIEALSRSSRICNIGWQPADRVYDYFLMADLAVFPGTHSVLWEQACGCGIPLLAKDWEGMHHVDVGGSCRFLAGDDVQELKDVLAELHDCPDAYQKMKAAAQAGGIRTFSYQDIARRALECVPEKTGEECR